MGPGAYDAGESFAKIKAKACSHIYRESFFGKDIGDPGYVMIGDQL